MSTQGFVDLALRLQKAGDQYCVSDLKQGFTTNLPTKEALLLFPESTATESLLHLPFQEARSYARQLFSTLFQSETLQSFTWARDLAVAAGSILSVRLHLDEAEELDDLPWELLTAALPELPGNASLLRCVSSPHPKQQPATLPIRILAIFSSPKDLPRFDVELERQELERALYDLTKTERISLECSSNATEAGLRKLLEQGEFQALHFVGYGRSHSRARHGSLIMQDMAGRSRPMTADHLCGLLGKRSRLRWAVLTKGGQEGDANPFAQTARILVRGGLEAVVAMRQRLGGTARNEFNRHFYTSALSGYSIEQSVFNARNILSEMTSEASWAIPMLYLAPCSLEASAEKSQGESKPVPPRKIHLSPPPVKPRMPAQRNQKKKRILILTASPENLTRLRLDKELREIKAGLSKARFRHRFQVEHCPAVRPLDLQQAMLDLEPHFVHFCGHGTGEEGLILEDDNGLARPVSSHALANLFGLFSNRVECVILNSCHSESQAQAISQHISYVIGMKKEIEDRAAINFAVGFYCALGAGHPIDFAFRLGRSAIELQNLPDHLNPVLLSPAGSSPAPGG